MVLDKRESKQAQTGRFELVFRDAPHPGFKCVDNKFFVEGARIRKNDLQRYSELDKKFRQKEKEKNKNKRRDDDEDSAKHDEGNNDRNGRKTERSGEVS